MKYVCPVCGYGKLPEPPADYLICPSCGTEFGYTDFSVSHEELFKRWLSKGMKWHSKAFPSPPNWNPVYQIATRNLLAESEAAPVLSQVTWNGPVVSAERARVTGVRLQLFGNLTDLRSVLQAAIA